MQCPNEQTTLAMTERQGIEIDYCPTCRGVWLDRGELDKLIAGSENSASPVQGPQQRPYQQPHHDDNSYYHKKRKKESFIGELLTFKHLQTMAAEQLIFGMPGQRRLINTQVLNKKGVMDV